MKKSSLFSSIIFFALGVVLFTNPDALVKFVSYLFGGILIIVGLYKSANYYVQDKKNGVVNRNEIAFGVTAIILGVIFIVLASSIEFLIRICFGIWMIYEGLSKISKTFNTYDRSSKFYSLIVIGFIFTAAGIYTIASANIALQIIGIFMMIYGVVDFASYFIKIDKTEENENTTEEVKEIEFSEASDNNEEEVMEAEIVEDKKPKKKSNTKGKKSTKK